MTQAPDKSRLDLLVTQAEAMLSAGTNFWRVVGLGQSKVREFAAVIQSARAADAEFSTALAARIEAMVQLRALDLEAWDLISQSRDRLKNTLGAHWSERWAPLGFEKGSLKVPDRAEGRALVLRRLGEYYAVYPEQVPAHFHENRALSLWQELGTASDSVEQRKAELKAAADALRDCTMRLRDLMCAGVGLLAGLLRSRDARWVSLHSHVPAGTASPTGKKSVATPRRLFMHSGAAVRAEPVPAPRPDAGPQPAAGCEPATSTPATALTVEVEAVLATLSVAALAAWLFPPAE
jgi:hypothetical protein